MATVADRSGNNRIIDKPYTSPNRRVTATPVNSLTPQYAGEIVEFYDSGAALTYPFKASSTTNTSWVRGDYLVH